ncbi:MAG: RNA polymerase sigma factor SigB [uncultured Nocardioides sp.]|uniref:RNA polymerase sigma factor SigB n=1 Tax=uncultured Nocardioides sp. TaxID=198441 RepID=A0A6J4MXW3_9ACTN|nr:MAG: RNA polymerase sigma factor SigB [uncultured Nocardioides sp.]
MNTAPMREKPTLVQVNAPRRTHQDPADNDRSVETARLLRIAHDPDETEARRAEARDRVVVINLPVARNLATRHVGRGIAYDDLVQVASLALVRAVDRFDPEFGRDFLSFAVPSIRGELKRHFRDLGWMVRPPRSVQEAQAEAVKVRDELEAKLGRRPTDEEVAEHGGLDIAAVSEALALQGCFTPASLDKPLQADGTAVLGSLIADPESQFAASEARLMVRPLLRRLDPRDRTIVRMRWFEQRTQQEIADAIGVTQAQVSRLLTRILNELRAGLEDGHIRQTA